MRQPPAPGNPDAGLWLPAILGLLGFVIFVPGSHPELQGRGAADRASKTYPPASTETML